MVNAHYKTRMAVNAAVIERRCVGLPTSTSGSDVNHVEREVAADLTISPRETRVFLPPRQHLKVTCCPRIVDTRAPSARSSRQSFSARAASATFPRSRSYSSVQ